MLRTLTITLALAAGTAKAEGPPLSFFVGNYDAIGRWEASDGTPISPLWEQLLMAETDQKLSLTTCELGTGSLTVTTIIEDAKGLEGTLGESTLRCAYYVTAGNYPFLSCMITEEGSDRVGRFALWPRYESFAAEALSCSD